MHARVAHEAIADPEGVRMRGGAMAPGLAGKFLAGPQPALARRALRVDKPVVLKHSGFHGRFEPPIRLDRWSVLGQLLVDSYAHGLGRYDGIARCVCAVVLTDRDGD
jgi:hypothetical protein